MSVLIVKTKLSSLPENVNWAHMLGAALLGGVGFTMAIFVANLAFVNPDDIMIAKVAILAASLVAVSLALLSCLSRQRLPRSRDFVLKLSLPPLIIYRRSELRKRNGATSESFSMSESRSLKTRQSTKSKRNAMTWYYEVHLHIILIER